MTKYNYIKYKEYQKKYNQSDIGKLAQKKYQKSNNGERARKKYIQSNKGKVAIKKYNQSDKCKETRKKYQKSDKCKETIKKYYQTNKGIESLAKYRLKHDYGITLEEYNKILIEQNSVCAICGRIDIRKLSVDHDHLTKKVRGLLCYKCNLMLGFANDSIPLLEKAIHYIAKNKLE